MALVRNLDLRQLSMTDFLSGRQDRVPE